MYNNRYTTRLIFKIGIGIIVLLVIVTSATILLVLKKIHDNSVGKIKFEKYCFVFRFQCVKCNKKSFKKFM